MASPQEDGDEESWVPSVVMEALFEYPPEMEGTMSLQGLEDQAQETTTASEFVSILLRKFVAPPSSALKKHEAAEDGENGSRNAAAALMVVLKARKALKEVHEEHAERPTRVLRLIEALQQCYKVSGALVYLDEAATEARRALDATTEGNSDTLPMLIALAGVFGAKIQRTNSLADIEVAVDVSKQIVNLLPKDDPARGDWLSALGARLSERFAKKNNRADMTEAIRVSREAVVAMPEGHPSHSTGLLRLARILTESHDTAPHLDADDAQLSESLRLYEQAARTISNAEGNTARGAANYAASLFAVGFGYCKTDPWARALATYDTGLEYMIHGILKTADESPSLTSRICRLGAAFRNRYYTSDDPFDLARALFCFVFVLYFCNGFPFERILAGAHFVRSSKDYDQAFEVAWLTMSLVPRLTTFSVNHADRQETLKVVGGLASNAVLVALKAGKGAGPALILLEQGHALLAASSREMVDIARLRREYPELYEKFNRLRNDLAMPSQTVSPVFQNEEESEASWIPIFRQQMIQEEELDQSLEGIRQLPDFERFLLPLSHEELLATADRGPVVRIITHNVHHGHALIIEEDQMRVLDLPGLTQLELWQHVKKGPADRQTLEWLWDIVTKPILDSLGFTSPPAKGENWPHVWWIPTGLLQTLPLHAAGYHVKQSGETVIDRVMSSYSSSLEAIIQGRRSKHDVTAATRAIRPLLVSMNTTPGKSSLPFASLETDVLRKLFRDASLDPVEPPRRMQDVLAALPTCEIFHFAGHGHSNEEDPLKSCLLLEDWKTSQFTVSTLLDLDVREVSPFLAYLSACGTGRIRNHRLRDQSLPLIGVYQLAGFRHVIGTLWEVQDEICVDMARMAYQGMIAGGMTDESVCRGLHDATRELRDRWVSSQSFDESFYRDESDVGSAVDEDIGQERGQRDLDEYDDDDSGSGPIHWAPYVHFGV